MKRVSAPFRLMVLSVLGALALPALRASSNDVLSVEPSQDRPLNVLFIMSDDLSNELTWFNVPSDLQTAQSPNIDALARRGMRFDRAYTQYPQCNQTRASLLTGMRPDTIEVYDLNTHFRQAVPDVVTLPQAFRHRGHFTARVGKIYHQSVPDGIGSDGLDDAPSWDVRINPVGIDRSSTEGLNPLGTRGQWRADPPYSDAEHTDYKVASEAIRLLEDHRDEPFFLAVGFYRPHFPYIAPQQYFDLYPIDSVEAPGDPSADVADAPFAALAFTQPLDNNMTMLEKKQYIRAFYASITFMDVQVGRVLAALERLGLRDNTLVVFMTDHGMNLGNKGQWMKQSLYERSAKGPLVMAGPGVPEGISTTRIVEFLDIYPTIADLAGLETPAHVEGRSLRPLMEDPDGAWHYPAFTQVRRLGGRGRGGIGVDPSVSDPYMGYSVRTQRWRYIEWGEDGLQGVELFDYMNDPGETLNLANEPAYGEIRAELDALLAPQQRYAATGSRAGARGAGPSPTQ